ncbi:MAG: Stk1 family PASTA domain-containing Ser/Thr kinase [Syntrophomonadaceae bacterium]|nr:Stk1 family PASTA domain-containing Ser/Thr kinase [Syntrophomonadaceae bacterium]
MKDLLQNRYELLEKIGEGGMATVYKARCTLLDRIVAVKILKEEYTRDTNLVAKFRSEAQSAARLSHPNIVNVYDVGEDRGANFIVMEYIEGINLKQYIDQKGFLSPEESISIALMICDALAQAHEKGLIHRDIKPHNIMLTRDGVAKVADFGIARAASTSTITFGGDMVGSVHYVSPEQARGEPVDSSSDIYSLGCVLYEMVSGRVPFDAASPVTVALKHIHERPIPPSVINNQIPGSLEEIIMIAMEKKSSYRYQTAIEMRQALTDALYGRENKLARKKRQHDKTLVMPAVGGDEYGGVARKKKIRPIGIIAIAAIFIGLALGIAFSMRDNLFGKEVTVPNVVGLSTKEAANSLEKEGLEMIVGNRVHSEIEEGHVVSQDPEADERVKEGRQVEVVLSLGLELTEVPDIAGKNLEDATFMLKSRGLIMGDVNRINDPEVAAGIVITQKPEKGVEVELGEKVDVTVSDGAGEGSQLNMPDLLGMDLSEAKAKLEADGLVLGSTEQQASDSVFAGKVIKQSISAGKPVERGESVSLVVSQGPGPLPKMAQIRYTLPDSNDQMVISIIVVDAKGRREVYNNTHPGGYFISRQIEFYGQATVYIMLDGKEVERQLLE